MISRFTTNTSRRIFIARSVKIAAGLILSVPLNSLARQPQYHTLTFYHTHTREMLEVPVDITTGTPDNVREVYHFLRDFRTGETHPIDFLLFKILAQLRMNLNSSGMYEVISGYRSPVTNEKLRNVSSGVAKKSLHLVGRAIDIRLSDVDTSALKNSAWKMKRGGVGYYPKSDFVHLDTGRVRAW